MEARRPARAFTRSANGPPKATPKTPVKKHHDEINGIIKDIEDKWSLGLSQRDENWSPSHNAAGQKFDGNICYANIKFLYWKSRAELERLLGDFDANAEARPRGQRLPYLRQLLEAARQKAVTANSTSSVTPTEPLKSKFQKATTPRSRAATGVQAGQSSVFHRPRSATGRTTRVPLNDENTAPTRVAQDELDAAFAPTQPDTPTVEERGRFISPPQSPSLGASRRRQHAGEPSPLHSREGNSRALGRGKRASDSSVEYDRSPKLSRTSGRKTKSEGSFAVPEPPAPRSGMSRQSSSKSLYQAANSSTTTSKTSFASTMSRTDSVFSHYRDNTTTAHTSFTSAAVPSQGSQELHSSATFDSLDSETWNHGMEEARRSFSASNPLGNSGIEDDVEPTQSSPPFISPSKSMEHHQVKFLPANGLFIPEFGGALNEMKFKYRWEFTRVALALGLEPEDLLPTTHNEWCDYDTLWDYFKQHEAYRNHQKRLKRSSTSAWAAADNNFENVTLKASLSFNHKNVGPLFKINLQPLEIEDSCRFQRAFGGDRFLYLQVPTLDTGRIPNHVGRSQAKNIAERFQEWLAVKKKSFLGRQWTVFHIEGQKQKSKRGTTRREQADDRGFRVILFATDGCDIPRKKHDTRSRQATLSSERQEMSVFDLINWFMPLRLNGSQAYPKAFARISLGLTTTKPVLEFEPSQVRFVEDILADGTPEDHQFNDMTLHWPKDTVKTRVMNDGCSRISVGAARKLWKNLNAEGPLPSTFQGRIGGAKGMWMISASPDTQDERHQNVWIEISDSQLKFKPHHEDTDKLRKAYDPHRLTFDLHSTSTEAKPSSVYLSFLSILTDRGVPTEALEQIFRENLDSARVSLLDAIEDPVKLRKWVNEQNSLSEERNRDENDIPFQASMPLQLQEKIVLLLESGFDPSCPFLADTTQRFVAKSLRLLRQSVRIPLPRCTYIKGVADPLGILKPGEIHVHFSKSFVDHQSGECFTFLENRPVLVARNPALRRSDIQKVHACFKIELAHLRDVVVFPLVGQYPLAGKLQGGDYDGDTFWVCWEPELVAPFKNAPPPLNDPLPGKYGIEVDNRKLKDMMKVHSIGPFLRASFNFHLKPSLLGQATKLLERVVYQENDLDSPNVRALADLHDLLVDYSKNGYIFDEEAYEIFKHTCIKLPRDANKKPAYEEAKEKDLEAKFRKPGANSQARRKQEYKKHNILDLLYFETIEPHTRGTLDILRKEFLKRLESPDPDLQAIYLAEKEEVAHSESIRKELEDLNQNLKRVRKRWTDKVSNKLKSSLFDDPFGDAFEDPDAYNTAVDECWNIYREISPVNAEHPVIRRWTMGKFRPGEPTQWELLKASALYDKWCDQQSHSFIFTMAGHELCWIKACASGNARPVVRRQWANMKPRQIKSSAAANREERERHFRDGVQLMSDTEEDTDEEETQYESAVEVLGPYDEID